jgi:hypothetical protein
MEKADRLSNNAKHQFEHQGSTDSERQGGWSGIHPQIRGQGTRMRYLIVLLLLVGCGIKPSATCGIDFEKETMKEITDSCVENPTVGIKKDF